MILKMFKPLKFDHMILRGLFTADVACPEGWLRQYDSCYLFNTDDLVTWLEAKTACENYDGAELVKIETERETSFLNDELNKLTTSNQIWTAGNDLDSETVWVWSGRYNSKVYYTNWKDRQPDNSGGEDCMTIVADGNYKWNDERCSDKLNYICELPDIVTQGKKIFLQK